MSCPTCKGPCLPHCYSKNNNYLLFIIAGIAGIILGILLYHIYYIKIQDCY